MSGPSIIGLVGATAGLAIVVVGLIANFRHVSRHKRSSLLGLRLQAIGFAVIVLTLGVVSLIAARSLGAPAAVAAGAVVVLLGMGVLYLATRLQGRHGPKDQ